ncbi:MAG: glycosyltransferase family 2 protein [Lachnospiraceae bacterium]|nr:glycosyltransferase family 2 protein [Lachnospiraceae bacterium]
MKELTIAIPSYNSEQFLAKALDSMCGFDDRLEVIVINDGSTDGTSKIAHEYEEKYPDIVRVIDKENGGHGSGINRGLKEATGRFYKVVDSDDWITTENLKPILDKMETLENIDTIIMGFKTVNISNGVVLSYMPHCTCENRVIDMIKLEEHYDDVSKCLDFHSMCFSTSFLRSIDFSVSEHVFYEDQEFAVLPFVHTDWIVIFPETFYEYRIGDVNQSTNFKNQAKKAVQHETVVKKMLEYYAAHKPMGIAREKFLQRRLATAVTSNYAIWLVKNPNKAEGKQKATEFHTYIQETQPTIAKLTEKRYNLLLKASHFKKAASYYGKLYNSKTYAKFKEKWTK